MYLRINGHLKSAEIKITESFHIPFEVKNAEINRYTVLRFKLTVRNCLTYMAYSFRESNSANFCLASWGSTLKKSICSSGSRFFPFRVDPIWEELWEESKRKSPLEASSFPSK